MNWQEFFHMGGYAPYVWSSYGIAAAMLAINIALPVIQHRSQLRKLQRRLGRADINIEARK